MEKERDSLLFKCCEGNKNEEQHCVSPVKSLAIARHEREKGEDGERERERRHSCVSMRDAVEEAWRASVGRR